MKTERLSLVDPFNDLHVMAIEEFEKKHEISTATSEFLKRTKLSITREEYDSDKKQKNEVEESLILKGDYAVKDCCHIQGEKDRKTCTISFPKIKSKKRELLPLATNYALSSLGMESVFIKVDEEDKTMIDSLTNLGFENLGEESGKIVYLIEKVDVLDRVRTI